MPADGGASISPPKPMCQLFETPQELLKELRFLREVLDNRGCRFLFCIFAPDRYYSEYVNTDTFLPHRKHDFLVFPFNQITSRPTRKARNEDNYSRRGYTKAKALVQLTNNIYYTFLRSSEFSLPKYITVYCFENHRYIFTSAIIGKGRRLSYGLIYV